MSINDRVIIIKSCRECPDYFQNPSYGEQKAHRCKQLLEKKPYDPFDEVIKEPGESTIDIKCPLPKGVF